LGTIGHEMSFIVGYPESAIRGFFRAQGQRDRTSIFALISDRDKGFDCIIHRRIESNLFSAAVLPLIATSYQLIQHA
ncbi:MAG TPA: hypothetical protein VFC37_21920, partial [Terracidiphilus sp.]|nr:hypothetical protein [Terracidiphilus sp.]